MANQAKRSTSGGELHETLGLHAAECEHCGSSGRLHAQPERPAYQKAETRQGLPLDYVAEKLRSSLESQHDLISELHAVLPEDLPIPSGHRSEAIGNDSPQATAKHDRLIHAATVSFHYQVTAWLGLNNMLGSAGPNQVQWLSRMSKVEFEKWLDIIDKEGSVSGI